MKLLIKLVAKLCQTNEMLKRENLTLATGIRILRNVQTLIFINYLPFGYFVRKSS
ncbi:MAG: hypothetical protein ACTS42_00090 [Candidatus Hodgkinia cicadicola]